MRFISLFAGIGGFDLGFEQAGLECVAQIEIDKDARAMLTHHWPDVPKFVDVRDVGKHNLPETDVICGGFPCQDLSVAGKRAGLEGNRSSLFFEMVRITDELRPSFLIWENVPGLLNSRSGADFWRVLYELDAIGYCGAWTMLDAQFFGLAQRRRRIFGVFTRRDFGAARCAEILSLADRLRWHPEKGREKRSNITTAITKSLGAGGADDNDAQGGLLIAQPLTAHHGRNNGADETNVSSAVALCNRGHVDDLAETLRSDSHGAMPMVFEPRFARNGRGAPSEVAPPLKAMGNGGTGKGDGTPVIAFGMKRADNFAEDLSPTLDGGGGGGLGAGMSIAELAPKVGANSYSPTKAMSGSAVDFAIGQGQGVRRLTPVECERLQGFPDQWTGDQPDSVRYRQLGNAVAVPVARWIGKRLLLTHGHAEQVGQG